MGRAVSANKDLTGHPGTEPEMSALQLEEIAWAKSQSHVKAKRTGMWMEPKRQRRRRSAGRRDAHRRDADQEAEITIYAGTMSNTGRNWARKLLVRSVLLKNYFEAYKKEQNPKKFEVVFKMYFSVPISPKFIGKLLFPKLQSPFQVVRIQHHKRKRS